MVDMDMKLCNRVSKFKMSDSRAGLWAWPKPPELCTDFLSLTTEGIVVIFYMIGIDRFSRKFEI